MAYIEHICIFEYHNFEKKLIIKNLEYFLRAIKILRAYLFHNIFTNNHKH